MCPNYQERDGKVEVSLSINNAHWDNVITIKQGQQLRKGRKNDLYPLITSAAGGVKWRFGCYSWGGQNSIFYCGSFSQDYKSGTHKSNLQARVHNYLQNHSIKEGGRKNTNLAVFENINNVLLHESVSLRVLMFDSIKLGDKTINYKEFTEDPDIVRATEQLLICTYKKQDQCRWNRS